MLWQVLAGLFVWLALCELDSGIAAKPGYPDRGEISAWYLGTMLAIAVSFAYLPMLTWLFERFLADKARIIAESKNVTVHCNTLFDTAFHPMLLAAGHANPETGHIVFQKPWSGVLMGHLKHPERMDEKEILIVQMFTHEAMHARGESNEAITECQATQRHYRAACLLGLPEDIARISGMQFDRANYETRRQIGGMQVPTYSEKCVPGMELDEKLEDST